ncbi:hypothetical protein GCM10011316_35970 [Roseibium aquae]|uniref:Uncharacterized protein n=1 Tax=Roseibium aquae TaxID=1323746 RepID=A0A916X3B9_9HYPH|nr:hypothetical protein GCM10011316_35970 [Roseibium aquae]
MRRPVHDRAAYALPALISDPLPPSVPAVWSVGYVIFMATDTGFASREATRIRTGPPPAPIRRPAQNARRQPNILDPVRNNP